MEDALTNICYNVLSILMPALVALVVEYLRHRLGTEKLKKVQEELTAKQDLASLAVRFVQQFWVSLSGQERYEKAAEWLSARAKERGLKVTSEEIKGLIEAALRMAKDEFGEEWGKIARDNSREPETQGEEPGAPTGSGAA
jgi:LL-H family phage holin